MPRGMDERFEDPNDEEDAADEESVEDTVGGGSEEQQSADTSRTGGEDSEHGSETAADDGGPTKEPDEPLNIREDWDSATIYIEPEQSEDIEITFTRLKKQLKRDGYVLEKNKHFYRAVFQVAFDEHRKETKERIGELVKQDSDSH